MKRSGFIKVLSVLAAMILLLAACNEGVKVGDDIDLAAVDQNKQECRLGECKSPEPSPVSTEKAGIGGSSPSPTAKPTQAEQLFDVTLVADSPYYEPGNDLSMPFSFTLRVTNNDRTEGRPVRSFTDEDGVFDSGPLKPGEKWTWKFDGPGQFKITDRAAGFIFANLVVR